MDCLSFILGASGFVIAVIAFLRGGPGSLQADLLRHRRELEEIKKKLAALERQLEGVGKAKPEPEPLPPDRPAAVPEEPHRATQPIRVQPELEKPRSEPAPAYIPDLTNVMAETWVDETAIAPEQVVPAPPPIPLQAAEEPACPVQEALVLDPSPTIPLDVYEESIPLVQETLAPEPPPVLAAEAVPVPDSVQGGAGSGALEPAMPERPLPPAARPPAPRTAPPPRPAPVRSRTLEDFLGTQIFLKLGIAILVIGIVFAMGLVFQKVGAGGKVAMGYAGGLALLAGGLYAEKRERYRTFGRTLIAGAWGILYFVTYAAGFIEPSRIFESKPVAVAALIVAASAAVAFSLRYRNEWTTTSAFLLIFLSLGISALEVQPVFNLVATLIVAFAMAVLIWRMGWVRLLGLGVPATWGSLAFWVLTRLDASPGLDLLLGFAGAWLAFQVATLGSRDEEAHRPWQAFAQIANFLGAMGLSLMMTQPLGTAWCWALAYGLAHLAVAWIHRHRGSRGLYLLAGTQALSALALVTPLRLGLKHPLTPFLRLIGIELVLAAGVFLKERYFRILAYGAFGLTVLEILVFKLRPSLGDERLLLLGAAGLLALLNAGLLRTWWRSACEGELPGVPCVFTAVGTLLAVCFVGIKVSLPWMGAVFAGLAAAWVLLGLLRGLKDLLAEGAVLGWAALFTLLAASADLPGAPGTVPLRGLSSLLGAGLLLLVYGLLRGVKGKDLAPGWITALAGNFSFLMTVAAALVLFRELPGPGVAPALGGLAVLMLLSGLRFGYRDLVYEAVFGIAMAFVAVGTHAWGSTDIVRHLAERTWSILGLTLALMVMEALFRVTWKRSMLRAEERGAGLWGMSLLGSTGLVLAVFLEATAVWIVPILSLLALLHLCRSLILRHKEHAAISVGIGGAVFGALLTHAWNAPGVVGSVSVRAFGLGTAAIGFLLQEVLLRLAKQRWPLSLGAWSTLLPLLSHLATVLLVLVIFLEIPSPWIAPLLSAFSLGHLLLGLGLRQRDHAAISLWLSATVLFALWNNSWPSSGDFAGLSLRSWSLALPAAGFLLNEVVLRRMESRWPWQEESRTLVGNGYGVLGATLMGLLVFLEAPQAWVSPCFMLLGVLWLLWARWRASALHAVESLLFVATGFLSLATHTLDLTGDFRGIPVRLISALGSLLTAFVVHYLLERSRREGRADRILLADQMKHETLRTAAVALLALTSLVLGSWIKLEALAHGKNLLVTLAWSLLGVLYLERGRASRTWTWILHGHLWLLAGLAHFLAVNLLQPGELGFLSLRLLTGLPFLGLLSYVYLNWPELDRVSEAPPSAARWRYVHLYGAQLAVAMVLLYEPHRAWVLPLWALQALISLGWGLRRESAHWLRSALILVVACGFRGIGANLLHRDLVGGFALNLVSVPAAALILLIGYVLLRRRMEGEARLDLQGLGAGVNRLPWLLIQALLLFGFIWVEASGTQLTVWLSAFGLGMVALGFLFQERAARLTGLGILSFCILKLFIFDLRGLTGLPRVLSFIVLGLVLIAVSYVYTRFKERLDKLL